MHRKFSAVLFILIVVVLRVKLPAEAAAIKKLLIASSTEDNANTAFELERQGKWRSAIPILLKSVERQPNSESCWLELSRSYIMINDFEHAESSLRLARKRFSGADSQKNILKMTIFCNTKSGKLEAVQLARREYVTKFPKEKDVPTINKEIAYYDTDFASTRKDETHGERSLVGYLPWLQFTRLPVMPISVYVCNNNILAGKSKIYTKTVLEKYTLLAKNALNEWAMATDAGLKFVFVDKPAIAQLRCEWTTDLSDRAHSWADGEAHNLNNATQGPVSSTAQIYLDSKHVMDNSTFYNVCLHEIGHALGLGHSSKPTDIMYFAALSTGKGLPHLSANDIARIRRMYSDPLLGRDVAEQFAEAAFVAGDFEKAYELLSTGVREKLSLSAFRETAAIKEPPPISLKVTHFERTKSRLFNYGLEGISSQAKFYYHVAIIGGPNHKFSVEQSNLVDIQPLKQ